MSITYTWEDNGHPQDGLLVGPDWSWRITLEAETADRLRIVMYNISPDGDDVGHEILIRDLEHQPGEHFRQPIRRGEVDPLATRLSQPLGQRIRPKVIDTPFVPGSPSRPQK